MEAEDRELVEDEDDVLGQIDLDRVCDEYNNISTMFGVDQPPDSPSPSRENLSNPSPFPDSMLSWIGEIENLLMKDDDDNRSTHQQFCNNFLADVFVDSPTFAGPSPSPSGGEVSTDDKESSASVVSDKANEKEEKQNIINNGDGGADDSNDPISKKRRRQLRNRDAAVRSRQRKKIYVRDLELKSRYLEGECRRLDHLLQCVIAENHALRLRLFNGNAFGVTLAKQESAVLLLESLLLGSLHWFLGIMCLFSLLAMPQSTLVAVPLENVGKKAPENLVPRGAGSKMFISLAVVSSVNHRRCKASRTRMKSDSLSSCESFNLCFSMFGFVIRFISGKK